MTCDERIRKRAPALAVASIVAVIVGPAPASAAQEPQPTVIRAGVLLDGTGAPPRANVAIVVLEGRIVEVRGATPADATDPAAIDLSAFHVLPGLIDTHAHLTMSHEPGLDYGEISAPMTAILGVVHARRTLRSGFTTVRDPAGPHYADVALRDAIAAGWIDGPRMFVSGTIEAGKRADLIAVASDPLVDIRQLEMVRFVMKAGVVVRNETGG